MTSGFQGYLTKKGHRFPTWKRRWVILEGSELLYFKDEAASRVLSTGKGAAKSPPSTSAAYSSLRKGGGGSGRKKKKYGKPIDKVPLVNAKLEPINGSRKRPFMWKLHTTHPKKPYWTFSAESEAEKTAWIRALSPFCALIPPSTTNEESSDAYTQALSRFETAMKSKPVDVKGIEGALVDITGMVSSWQAVETEGLGEHEEDFEVFVDVAVAMSADAVQVLIGKLPPGVSVIRGKLLVARSKYLARKAERLRRSSDPEAAPGVLLAAWQDALTAWPYATTFSGLEAEEETKKEDLGRLLDYLHHVGSVCASIAEQAKATGPASLAAFAKAVNSEVTSPALISWVTKTYNSPEAGKLVAFGFVGVKGDGLLGWWRRRFCVLATVGEGDDEDDVFTMYDAPGGKIVGSWSKSDVSALNEEEESQSDHQAIFTVTLRSSETGSPVVIAAEYSQWRSYWMTLLPPRIRFAEPPGRSRRG